MNELLELLKRHVPGEEISEDTDLSVLLDSLKMVTLIFDLEETFDISIKGRDMKPENFKTATAVLELVKRLEDE